MLQQTRSRNAWQAAPYAVLLVGWAVLLPGSWSSLNPDGVVYATLTEALADGRWSDAVTGYWSILLPTLAAPLTALGVPAPFALRAVLLLVSVGLVAVIGDLARRAGATTPAREIAQLLVAPFLVVIALWDVFPDGLLALLLLLFVRALLAASTVRGAALAGLWGGLAYLAKPVALPFVLAFLVLVTVVRLWASRRPTTVVPPSGVVSTAAPLRTAAVTAAVALALAAPWITLISVQAGHPTITTAASFNANYLEPGVEGNPLESPGLRAPTAAAPDTPWQNPSALAPVRTDEPADEAGDEAADAAPAESGERIGQRLGRVAEQAGYVVETLVRKWPVETVLALAGTVLAARRPREPGSWVALGSTAAAGVLAGGMMLLIVTDRYLWFSMLALLVPAAVALQALGARRPRALRVLGAALSAVVALATAFWFLALHQPPDRDRGVWALAERACPEGLDAPLAGVDEWGRSNLLAYLCGVPYVGLTGSAEAAREVAADVSEVGARYLVVWDDAPAGLPDSRGDAGVLYELEDGTWRPVSAVSGD
ncbi:hypothetical protein [uncultured Modestobacter sp.]|uniref:hypothetical protein n=1 Tax=uncultured Modestobacter sp. TaxID=380048 RepID=UPI002616E951|nr:hypothetical protein [uncultured Modestobacter sp.]